MEIKGFTKDTYLNNDDIIIVSKFDDAPLLSAEYSILIYEDLVKTITDSIAKDIQYNYDYYYLKNALEEAKSPMVDTIYTGSSYSTFGIENTLLHNVVNTALALQDLYYSYKCLQEICATNQNIKRTILTVKENTNIITDITNFCNARNINLLFVVTPFTKYYREYSFNGFKEAFYDILNNKAEGVVHLLDLYEDAYFTDEDFNDSDHLGDLGAIKLTSFIQNVLQQINNEGK